MESLSQRPLRLKAIDKEGRVAFSLLNSSKQTRLVWCGVQAERGAVNHRRCLPGKSCRTGQDPEYGAGSN